MPKIKSQIRKEQAEVLANAIKSEPKEDWGKIAQKELKNLLEDQKRKNEHKKRKELGVFEAIGISQFGHVFNLIGALDNGDNRIISDKEETAKRKQQKEHFEKEEEKEKEKVKRKKEPDPRGPFIQFMHQKEDENRAWNRIVNKYIMLLAQYADIDLKGILVDPDTGIPMNGIQLSKNLKLSRQGFIQITKLLDEENIMISTPAVGIKGNQKNYRLNEEFFNMKGQKIEKKQKFTKVYVKALRTIIKRLEKAYGEVGNELSLLRIMTEKFHYQTFYLCSNPNDNVIINPELTLDENLLKNNLDMFRKLKFYTIGELMELSGYQKPEYVLELLDKLHKVRAIHIDKDEEIENGRVSRRTKRRILIHPDLMYRGSEEFGKSVYAASIKIFMGVIDLDGGVDEF